MMATGCAHSHPHLGLKGRALKAELEAAEMRCAGAEQRLTAPRRRVLELLLEAGHPLKAYDLIAAFGQDDRGPAKPPTVYRALEFLERQGFAHRIESLNAYVACRQGPQAHAAAFLICDCCGDAREVEPEGAERLAAVASRAGYAIRVVTMEAHGLCADCIATA
jgi:Fur family transcriptional regulator, zinc uptake regulator